MVRPCCCSGGPDEACAQQRQLQQRRSGLRPAVIFLESIRLDLDLSRVWLRLPLRISLELWLRADDASAARPRRRHRPCCL